MTKIIGLIGDEGTGKTLMTVILTAMFKVTNKNIEIFSNMRSLKIKHYDFNTTFLTMINNIKLDRSLLNSNRLAIVDEVYRYMDSRQSMTKRNIKLSQELVQIRKSRFNLIYTSVLFEMIDLRLRSISDVIIHCKDYDPESNKLKYNILNKYGIIYAKKMITVNPYVYELYDTYEHIGNNDLEGITDIMNNKPNENDIDTENKEDLKVF